MSYSPISTEMIMLDKYLKVKKHLQKDDEDVVNW